MPNDQLALKVFSQKISESEVSKMVDQVIAIIAKQSGRLETEVRKEFQGIQVGEDLADQIINELKKASQILGNKSFNIGADLFKGIFDAKGVEEEINKVVKTFEDKIGALTHLKDQIGDDKIFANMLNNIDTDQLDELIKKTRQLIELEQERNSLSGTDKAKVTRQIKALDKELSASIGQIKIDFNVDTGKINEANEALSKYNVSQEEALKKAKELSKQRNVSSSYIDKDNIDDIKDMVAYMQRYIELVKQAGGSEDEALKKLRSEVGASNVRRLTGASGDSGYSDYKDEIQGVRTEVSKLKQEAREIGTGGQLFDESELKKQQQELNNVRESLTKANAQLDEMNQKYSEQSNLINELENKLKALEGLNDPKVIESDEYKKITEELIEAKNRASELQNELDNTRETVQSLSRSLDSYNTNELIPKEYLDNADNLIDSLHKKINNLESSLNETEQSFESLSNQLNNLQQDNSSLTEQVSQQKQIIEVQEEQISSLKRQVTEIEELKNNYNELLSIISKLESVQRKAESAIKNTDEIKAFKDATERVNWNEGINAPEGFVNFDYLEKAKQKLEEVGDRYEKNIKAAVYYHQYLEKGGTERIFDSSGKDVTDRLTSIYSKMESYIGKIGDIDQENAVKILRNVNQTLIARREEAKQLKTKISLLDKESEKLEEIENLQSRVSSSSSKSSSEDKSEQDNQDETTPQTSPIPDSSKLVVDQKELQGAMSATEQQARETAQAIENVGVSGANQDKTQAEIEETKADVQQLGNEAKETKQNLEDLGKTDVNPDIKGGTTTSGDATPQQDPSSIISEQQALENLKKAINSVTIAIAQKNEAIQAEEIQMDHSVNEEIAKLKELENKLTAIRTEFQNGILSRGKNTGTGTGDGTNVEGNVNIDENNNTADVVLDPKLSDTFKTDANNLLDDVKIEKDVDLKPTYEAGKFKEEAERILTFENVEKEVAFKVGDLDTSGITGTASTVTSPVSENVTSDNVIEEQNKDLEEQQRLYNNIIRLLTEYLSLQDRINSGNRNIASGDFIYSNDIRKQTGKVSQRAVKDQLNNYLNTSKNENGVYNDDSIKRTKEQLAAYVANFDNAEKAAEIFGNKNKEVFNEIIQMINDAKVSLDAYNKAQLEIDVVNDQLVKLNKLQSGEKLTFGQLWGLEKVVKTDGLEAGLKYITDELGVKIPEAAKKAESALAEVKDELNKPQQQQVTSVEDQTGNNQEGKKSGVIQVPIEPLIDQTSWEKEIDRILNLIGTKKIKIEPDMTSEEWNTLKNYIDNISKQIINMKPANNDSDLPSDLSSSYKNSEKYIKELYSLEEKIAQAKEKNSEKDLKQIANYEAEKKQLEELIQLEKDYRSNSKFSDIYTSKNDDYLSKLQSTLSQEYEANRKAFETTLQSSMSDIMDNAYKDNEAFDNVQNLKKVNDLLDQQKNKWQEIQDIRVKISSLDPVDDVNEISNLNSQKANLEQELSGIQKEIDAYDTLNAKKKQSNELDKITSNADKQVNANALERINKLQKEYVNNLKEQSRVALEIAKYPINDAERSDEDTEKLTKYQKELNDLTNEQSKLIEKINKALTEEQSKSEKISKALKSLNESANINVSDIGRTTNIDDAYKSALRINDALNKTENSMNILRKEGKGDIFEGAFSAAESDIRELNTQLASGTIGLTQYNSKISEIKRNLATQKNAIAIVDDVQISNIDETRNVLDQYIKEITNGTVENTKFNEGTKTLSGTFKNARGEIQNVSTSIKTLSDGTSVVVKSFGTAQKEVSSFSKWMDELSGKFRNLSTYLLSFVGFYEVFGAFRQGIQYVREFDTALTEMRKVSNETISTLKEFQQASFDIADSVGATAGVIQNSTADWMRLGESLEEASKSAEVSNILLNVSEFEDISSATDALVSMSQAYQDLDKIDIVDKMNNIGNKYSIATDGIATALQDSASALVTAGNDIDEAIALITAGNAVVQDPNSVGAGLRTISLRLTGTEAAKEELESLGEDTEGYAETVSKLRDTIMSATKVAANGFEGFDILDENGNYKSTYEILQGIADIYEQIVETDKQFGTNNANLLLETLAGKNRANIAASILQNPEMLRSVYEDSQTSEGSAQQELDAYLDSIEGEYLPYLYRNI